MKVSVLMPVYNSEKFLKEAIDSVLAQTYKNFEFIILNDCSTDKSEKIILKYKDKRIKYFKNEINLGITKSRNKLFKLADKKSKYFMIFDSDDVCDKYKLEEQVWFLENMPYYGVVGSNIEIINEKSQIINNRIYKYKHKDIQTTIYKKSPVAQPSVLMRSEIIKTIGCYSEDYNVAEDYEFWLRINQKYKIGNLPYFLLKYRITTTQSKTKQLKQTLKNTIKIQKQYIFKKQHFTISNLLYWCAENILVLLPNKVILELFKWKEFK